MTFLVITLGIVFLLCIWGCVYFAWKLYISRHSEHGMAVVDKIIKESRTYRPYGWNYKAHVHVIFEEKMIEQELSFWARESKIDIGNRDYQVPVLLHTDKNGNIKILIEDKKALLGALSFVCGGMALIFGVVLILVAVYA